MGLQLNAVVDGQQLTITNSPVMATGGNLTNTISFTFNSDWDGFTKTLVCWGKEKEPYHILLDSSNTAPIPQEVLDTKGVIMIGVFGVSGDKVITSEAVKYILNQGAITKDSKPSDPTPDIYAQLISEYNALNGANRKTVLYFGDSLTQGNQDGTGVSRKSVLSSLLGEEWTVKNYGVEGEGSHTISARASGAWLYLIAGETIPADGSAVEVSKYIVDIYNSQQNFGSGIYSSDCESWETVNPCYVNGVECILQKANASSPVTIKRSIEGDEVNISRMARINMNSKTFEKNPVLILCLGQNEGFSRNADILISQLKGIIDFFKSERYIIVGIPHALYGYTWESKINAELQKEFGNHFLDAEGYMKMPIYGDDGSTIVSSYALEDAGLTPTDADLKAISNYQYPPSIMYDDVNFNHYGYEVWGNIEYELGKDLGYWT